MKKFLYSMIAIGMMALLSSCANNENSGIELPTEEAVYMYAMTDSSATRTALEYDADNERYHVVWTDGDQFYLYLKSSGTKWVFNLESGAGTTTGLFKCVGGLTTGSSRRAYFPATLELDENADIIWPTQQTYVQNGTKRENRANAPMKQTNISVSQKNGVPAFTFQPQGGVLQVKATGGDNVREVRVSTSNYRQNSSAESQVFSVTLDCGTNGVELDAEDETIFYVALPKGIYTNVSITFESVEGELISKTASQLTIKDGKIYPVSFDGIFAAPEPLPLLDINSPVGTIGMLNGLEAIVVDLGTYGGHNYGKVGIATKNLGCDEDETLYSQGNFYTIDYTILNPNNVAKFPATLYTLQPNLPLATGNDLPTGWHVPSADEWNALLQLPHFAPDEDVWERFFYWPIGDNQLIIPCVGYRAGTSNILPDVAFAYWSSTQYGDLQIWILDNWVASNTYSVDVDALSLKNYHLFNGRAGQQQLTCAYPIRPFGALPASAQ